MNQPLEPDQKSNRADLLRRILDAITTETELEKLADRVAELVVDSVGADVCFVHLVEADQVHLGLIGATPPYSEQRGKIRLAVGDGIAGWVAQAKVPAIVPDKWNDPRYEYIPALGGENFQYLISVPMLRPGGRIVGVLNVHWTTTPEDPDSLVRDLQYVANLFAANVEMAAIVEKLERREQQLETFAANTIAAQELERKRISNDIHDGLGQLLHSSLYHLDAAMYPENIAESRIAIERAKELVLSAIKEVKNTMTRLRPGILDDLGLIAGLKSLCASIGKPEVVSELPEELGEGLSSAIEITVYRIVQEALANAQKHSGADWASLKVWVENDPTVLHAVVTDDGNGMEVENGFGGFGISGMKERAELIGAQLEIYSRQNFGTRIHLRVPVT